MVHIITPGVHCPLCDNQMSYRKVMVEGQVVTVYFCRDCAVGIYDFDPALNKWRDTDKKIPCPNCSHNDIRWFARYMDGFFKGKCPACGAIFESDVDVRFGKGNDIIIPEEMEEDKIEEPTQLKIPIDHIAKKFGWGKEKTKEIKDRRKKKDESQ